MAIQAYNKTVEDFKKKANIYVSKLPRSDVDTLRTALAEEQEIGKRFQPEWKEWAADYGAAEKSVGDLLAEKDAKQKELDSYATTIFDTYQKRINQLLETLELISPSPISKGKPTSEPENRIAILRFSFLKRKSL